MKLVFKPPHHWLALIIGNSRLHWAAFTGTNLHQAWDTPHFDQEIVQNICHSGIPAFSHELGTFPCSTPLYLVSVIPAQTQLWQNYPHITVITLEQIPLLGVYSTLGIDRAIAVWGAGQQWGWPTLVLDAGTALTFTGADHNRCLIGGAILPGLSLQLKSLHQETALLPALKLPEYLPDRWALNTATAIHSGVIYTILAGIRDFITDWEQKFPGSAIVVTGGDHQLICNYLQVLFPGITDKIKSDSYLIFWGIRSLLFSTNG